MTARPVRPPALLAGRGRELAALGEQLGAALAGRGSLVLIRGEEGIGKTALAAAVGRDAGERGALVLAAHCYDEAEAPPYRLWRDLAERYPRVGDLPPLPAPLVRPGAGAAPGSREELFLMVREFLAALASRWPLFLLLEDLHWADAASLDLLRSTARHLAGLPVLIVGTYRAPALTGDHPLHTRIPAFVREAGAVRLDLEGLSEEDVTDLVAARDRLGAADARRLAAYLQARAEGNPLFIMELLRGLELSGQLLPTPAGWRLGGLARAGVPSLLRQLLDGRLCRLGGDDRRLLTLAAVIGRDVPLDLWAEVAGAAEGPLLDTIERAQSLHLLVQSSDGARVRFVHGLMRDACYEAAMPARRRDWHRRIGEALAARPHPDPDEVASHFRRAGDSRAAEWLVRAGDHAYRTSAYQAAVARYEEAEALLGDSASATSERGWLCYRLGRAARNLDPARARHALAEAARGAAAAGDRALAAVTLYHRGQGQLLAGEYQEGLAGFAAGINALNVLTPAEQAELAAHADLTGIADVASCRGPLAAYLADTGRFTTAREQVEQWMASESQPAPGDPHRERAHAESLYGLGMVHAALGQPAEARRALAKARDRLAALGLPFRFGIVAVFELTQVLLPYHADQRSLRERLAAEVERVCHPAAEAGDAPSPAFFRAPFLAAAGEWATARDLACAALAQAQLISVIHPAQCLLGEVAYAQGVPDLAWQQVRAALPTGPETAPGTVPIRVALAMQHLAAALAIDAGKPEEARAWLAAADRWLAWSGAVRWQAEQRLLRARCHRAEADLERAYRVAAEAVARASAPRQPLALLVAHRLLGELATELGRLRDAATHLASALPLADACALPHERALTLLALAELRAAEGRRDDAEQALATGRQICAALGAAPALARADALAARLAAADPPAAYPAGLSAREVEVLRLLARGLRNREVADTLFLSERTVQVHVRHILTKTDTANRAAAVAFALKHGLA